MSMKIKDGKETVTTKIAYIAGFFDGEGCIRIKQASQRGNSFYIIAHITNSNRAILEQVQDLFDGTIRLQEKKVNKTVWSYYVTSAEAVDFLTTLSPFLREKKEEALLAIKFHNQKDSLTSEEKASWARVMRELKKRDLFPDPFEVIGNVYENPNLLQEEKGNK